MQRKRRFITAAALVGTAAVASVGTGILYAQTPAGPIQPGTAVAAPASMGSMDAMKPLQTPDISLAQAQAVVAAAVKQAESMGIKEDIAVVDAGGNLKAFARMDGAWLGSIDIAIKKAKTARYFDMPTGDLGKASQPGGPLYNIEVSNGGLISFPGGIPLKSADGTILGAVGASGTTVEKDHAIAQAGVDALSK